MATTVTRPTARGQWSPAPAETDATATWQRAVLDELRGIRAALERQPRPSHLTRGDRSVLARLLPAVVGVYGAETFTSRDLAEDDRPAVRLVVRGRSVKQLAKLLARADGIAIDRLMVKKQGIEFQVTVWQVVAC